MRLKRLELFGFKSFADRTSLEFDSSLVGIVGPNGCGKSNVVDAVRWVLGEQRPTSMRGDEMTDVIFKGSVSRPALAVAEVTMVLSNEGDLEERGDEVSITRRVYRSGEGEYLIDGDRVRLKDVREMLYGTGLGSRGYAVLEQGKIDAVLSANALERRAIFEEAAGISLYRQRKKEIESRLRRVEQDVNRLDDLLGELERRERSLKIQAGKAQRFLEARDGYRSEGLRLVQHQAQALEQELVEVGRRLAAVEGEAEALRVQRAEAEGEVATRELEQEALAAETDRLAAESAEVAGEVRALDERRQQLESRLRSWAEAAEEERQRGRELSARLAERRTEADALEAQGRELAAAAAAARATFGEAALRLTERVEAHREARARAEDANRDVLAALDRRTSAKNRAQHLEQAFEPLEERVRRATARSTEARAEHTAALEEEERAARDLEERQAEVQRVEARRARAEANADELERRALDVEGRRSELDLECTRLASRIESLLDREAEREGLDSGARSLFEGLESGDGPALEKELEGLLADHVRSDTRHARALDAVLSGRAQALVAGGPADAAAIVKWLKERELGRVQLVLLESVHGGHVTPGSFPWLEGLPGVEGRLIDLVQPEPGFRALAEYLLAGVYVVETVGRAFELAREHPDVRFVTPDGDLVDRAGVAGGHVGLAQGPVGRRSFAHELEAERDVATGQRAGLEAELEELRSERSGLQQELVELRRDGDTAYEERTRVRAESETARARREELERSVALFEREERDVQAEKARLGTELEEARRILEAAEASYATEARRLEEVEAERARIEVERDEAAEAESRARAETAGLDERLEAARRRAEDLGHVVRELEVEIERSERLVQETEESRAAGSRELEALADRRVQLLERRGELETRLQATRERERAGRGTIEELRRRVEARTQDLEALLSRVSETRLEEQRVRLAREEAGRRAQEDFGVEPALLLAEFEPDPELVEPEALSALSERVGALKKELERLGGANLDAVEELQEVSERLGFLGGQRKDLDEARRSLEGTLKKLEVESERLFLETFEAVRTEFRTLFRQLFGGGRADVTLSEGPVLEAGIEIVARPPGREALPITLLSGGQRTLTALAILFAVFNSRPSPFCILDEVDAALDDANIGRFLSLLQDTARGTQFVIVTHNKGTMAACSVLYGVTMATRGVSRVVGVELSDVDEFVPDSDGGSGGPGGAGATPSEEEVPREPDAEATASKGGSSRESAGPAGQERTVELVPVRPGATVHATLPAPMS